jgi:hypothetical protein
MNARAILFAASLLAIATFVVVFLAARDYAQQQLHLSAQAASYTVEAALVFDDRRAIAEAVQSFTENPETARIDVLGPDGAALFQWQGETAATHFWGEEQLRALAALSPGEWPVMHQGRQVGTVIVTGSAEELVHLLARTLVWMLACLLAIGIAAWLLIRRLQRALAEPLAAMARAAHEMRKNRTFARRLPGTEIAEIDSLSEDFNALLAEIETWHDAAALLRRVREQPLAAADEADPAPPTDAMFFLRIGAVEVGMDVSLDSISRGGVRVDPKVVRLARPGGGGR